MQERIRIDYGALEPFVRHEDLASRETRIRRVLELLDKGEGPGHEYTGWVRYPEEVGEKERRQLRELAEEVRERADAMVVIGIGGSYLGARAVIEALGSNVTGVCPGSKRNGPAVLFAGQNLDGAYLEGLLESLGDARLYVNMVSKSGTTTEPGVAFRLFRRLLEQRHGAKEAARRIIATTDPTQGALRKLAEAEGYRSFVIPRNIGGRYSVLTPAGLFPIAVSGISADRLLAGAASMLEPCSRPDLFENPASLYACARSLFWEGGRRTEILVTYNPRLSSFAEWWKQLYGESEGKDGKGIFPASALFTTDLHSLGQWMQQGPRTFFETVIRIREAGSSLRVPSDQSGFEDGLGYLEGRTWSEVQEMAYQGTRLAHHRGGVPILTIEAPRLDAFTLGQLIYFFQKACGLSGYLLGVNPFDQPGVEDYKKNMFALLGKPGCEKQQAELETARSSIPADKIV